MQPSHITIEKGSRHLIDDKLIFALQNRSIAPFIRAVHPVVTGRIDLSSFARDETDIRPLMRRLVAAGIDPQHITVHWPNNSPKKIIAEALALGISKTKLSLGSDVAERDSSLSNYFIETSIFLNVYQKERHIVVGPKGSGKSAILSELVKRTTKNYIIITPEHYAVDVLDALSKRALPNTLNAYVTTWKYSLLVEILQKISRNQSQQHHPED